MIPAKEIIRSIYGAYRLARYDEGGMAFFNVSVEGFWRSFFAALIIAPFYILLLYLRFSSGDVEVSAYRYILVETTGYIISWLAFPVVMISLSTFLECADRYLGFIVAYNWASILQNGLYLPLAILTVNGILPVDVSSALSMIVLLMILAYTWFVAHVALRLTASMTAGVVAMDLIISIFVNAIAESML